MDTNARETVTCSVGGYETFARKLRGTVKRCLEGKGGIFGRREHERLAVNRSGGGERDLVDTGGAHGFEHARGCDRVLLEVLGGVIEATTHVGVGLQVEDPVATRESLLEEVLVEHVAFDEGCVGAGQHSFDEGPMPRPEVVHDHDFHALVSEAICEVATNEARATSDAGSVHSWSLRSIVMTPGWSAGVGPPVGPRRS
jgi:hypothetical protein